MNIIGDLFKVSCGVIVAAMVLSPAIITAVLIFHWIRSFYQ